MENILPHQSNKNVNNLILRMLDGVVCILGAEAIFSWLFQNVRLPCCKIRKKFRHWNCLNTRFSIAQCSATGVPRHTGEPRGDAMCAME